MAGNVAWRCACLREEKNGLWVEKLSDALVGIRPVFVVGGYIATLVTISGSKASTLCKP